MLYKTFTVILQLCMNDNQMNTFNTRVLSENQNNPKQF